MAYERVPMDSLFRGGIAYVIQPYHHRLYDTTTYPLEVKSDFLLKEFPSILRSDFPRKLFSVRR